MIHTIENESLSISIAQKGAEICSIKSKATDREYIWQALPEVWGSSAPVLFPIIGTLKNQTYHYQDQSYTLPKHGLVRNNEQLRVVSFSKDKLELQLSYSEESLKQYPFRFLFSIVFQLKGGQLEVLHRVENLGEGEMLFSLGGHPAFRCPWDSNEEYEDYFIEFEEEEHAATYPISKEGLTTGDTKLVLDNTKKLPLTKTLFDEDALIFKNLKSKLVSLHNSHTHQKISIRFDDFDYLGIWAKPGAPFVCLEPWLGITDDVNSTGNITEKEGMQSLAAKEVFRAQYTVVLPEKG